MANNEAGAFLNITPDILNKLESFDKKLEQIQNHAKTASDALKSGFSSINTSTSTLSLTIGALAKQIDKLNTAGLSVKNIGTSMNSVSQDATKAATSLSSAAQTLNRVKPDNSLAKSVEQYRGIAAQIEQISNRQKQLNDIIKPYEQTMARIQSGKGGVIQAGQQQQVQAARQELEANNQLLASLRQKQQEIINTNKAYQQQIQLAQQLRNYNQEQNSLPNQRSKKMQDEMRAYYTELEKSSARAAKQAEQAAAREEKARAKAADKAIRDAERKAAAEEKAAQRTAKAADALARQQEIERRTTPQGALDYSKNAKTLQEQVNAINYLKKARLSLDTSTKEGRNSLQLLNTAISQHNQALQQAGVQSQNLARHQRNLWDVSGQLQRQIALVFSVSSIEGYIKKIVEVRGQFELQQVALRAIVQDKNKADEIFSKTMQQALKSNFQAMELVTYTKQLAAYRIESDKLFDTTKRLADVSAGLGVDMQRLILAYGQVKAAAYLRGTEVRQFTEAGINMYGELQSYFEEVKGEAYTTAQIVDMISKRMVKFEDVEAVFQRMTDKGGLFFNMQEVQVNTLHGQINRLKDVISIMMNEIGKSNQEGFGSISHGISLINTLLENWRLVAIVLQQVIAGYAAYKAISFIVWMKEINWMKAWNTLAAVRYAFMKKQTLQTQIEIMNQRGMAAAAAENVAAFNAAAAAQERMNIAMKMNPWGMALSAVVSLGVAIYQVVQYTNRLEKALDDIAAEGAFNVVQSSNDYAQLASVVTDSTKSYQEHNKALAELKKKYSDILPEQYLNAEGIKALNGNYNEAIKLIHQYINAKTKERMIDEVGQDANKEMYEKQQKVSKVISKIIKEQHGMKVSWREISGELSQVQDKLMNGTIKSTQQLREETKKVVEQYTGLGNINLSGYLNRLSMDSFGGAHGFRFDTIQIERSQFKDWFESARSYISQVKYITQRYSKGSISMTAQQYQEQKDIADKMIANAMRAYDTLRDSQKKNSRVTKEELEQARALVQKALKAIGSDVQVDSAYINKLFNDSFFFEDEKRKATQTKLKQLFDKLTKEAKESGDTSGAVWLQEFEKQINGLNLNPLQNSIKNFLLGISGNDDIQANWNIRSGETEEEFKKRIKTEIDTRNEIIRKSQSIIYPEYGQDTSKVESELEELVRLYDELGGDKKKKDDGSKAERDIWAERISVLKEMQARYEKLNQLMGENRAIAETRTAFEGALKFTRMGDVIKAEDIIPTKQGMIDALEKLLKQIPNDAKNAAKKTGLEKEIAELKIGIQQDYLKEQLDKTKQSIEDMFNGLDLHQKLKDAGLSEAEVQALFPGLAKTLEEVKIGMEAEYNRRFPKGEHKTEGTEANKQYKADQEKLNQQRIKESQDLVMELTKAYKTQLSDQLQLDNWYSKERAKIYAKAYDEQSKTFKDVLTPEMQKDYEANLTKEYEKKTSENTWKDFQATDSYISMFENMDKMSGEAIQRMLEKLESLRSSLKGLPADQVRAIINQMEKLRDEQIERNPFKAAIDGIKELKKAREGLVKLNENGESTGIVISEEEVRRLQVASEEAEALAKAKSQREGKELQDLERQREELMKYTLPEEKFKKDESGELTEEYTDEYKKQLSDLNQKIEAQRKVVNLAITEAELQGKISKAYADQLRGYVNAEDKIQKGAVKSLNKIAEIANESSSAITDIAGNLENVFGTMSAGTKDTSDSMSEILGGVGNMAAGAARMAAGDWIGGAFQAVGGLAKTIGSIFAIGDKKKEREIQRQIKNVERLKKEYENLKEAMDAAWSSVEFEQMNKNTLQNIDNQIASYEAMIKAEEDKKKTDNGKIEEWQNAIDELKKTRKEIQQQAIEEMGGIGETNYKDAAGQFVQSWMDAFNETEDGLKALNENFDDFITNLIVKQATMRLAQNRLKGLFEEIDKSVTEGSEGGTDLTKEELANIQSIGKTALEGLNEDLLALMETLGYKPNKKAELSALTQSIQSISESTAEELAALLNSVRFFVSQQTTDISAIRALLEARYSLESEYSNANPMLVELRAQTGYLEILSDRIDRVFTTNVNSRGAALRVVMQ